MQILNPLTYPNWDDLVLTNPNYSFFHSSSWARVLYESYKYKPLYFTSIENSKLSALTPVMEIKSFLTGKRGVSLPFTDFSQPIFPNGINFKEIIESLVDYGKKAGWKYIEIRGGENAYPEIPTSSFHYGHTLDLSENEQELLSSFRSSNRRNIKKAVKEGVEVKISNTLDATEEFYRLNCMTRKHHGLPPPTIQILQEHT